MRQCEEWHLSEGWHPSTHRTIGDWVALALYGDNEPKGLPVGSTADLGVTLAAIGRRLAEARD